MNESRNPGQTPTLVPDRSERDRYLEDTIVVDWQTPKVLERARDLCSPKPGQAPGIRAAWGFVRDEIGDSLSDGRDVLTCNASHVLREGTGLSYAKSHLLAALLRARGFPAGFGYQRLRDGETRSGFALHGFVGVWVGELDTWVALDPCAEPAAPAGDDFLAGPVSWARIPDPEAGETTYPTLFARPPKRVLDPLERGGSPSRIRRFLPDAIV